MLSRRAALLGGGTAVAGVVGLSRVRPWSIESWEPNDDTWPLERYDLANSAANRSASVPPAPTLDWQVAAVEPSGIGYPEQRAALVVGPETVYAGGDRVTALDRRDGTERWTDHLEGVHLALRGDRLYAASDSESVPVRAYETTDGTDRWSVAPAGRVRQLLVADGAVVVGHNDGLATYDASDGSRRWLDDERGGSPKEGILSAIADGALYSVDRDEILRYRSRSILNRGLGLPPSREWAVTDSIPFIHPHNPVVEGQRMIVGTRLQTNQFGNPPLVAFDTRTGAELWRLPLSEGSDKLVAARTPAIADELGITGVQIGDYTERNYIVSAVSLENGGTEWSRSLETKVTDVVVGADTAVVSTEGDDMTAGIVVAFDPQDGAERWRRTVEAGVLSLALVDGELYVLTGNGDVARFR